MTPRRCPACLLPDPAPGHHCVPRAVLPMSRPELQPRKVRGPLPGRAERWGNFHRPDRPMRATPY